MTQFSFAAHNFLYLYTHIRFGVSKPNFSFNPMMPLSLLEVSERCLLCFQYHLNLIDLFESKFYPQEYQMISGNVCYHQELKSYLCYKSFFK